MKDPRLPLRGTFLRNRQRTFASLLLCMVLIISHVCMTVSAAVKIRTTAGPHPKCLVVQLRSPETNRNEKRGGSAGAGATQGKSMGRGVSKF